jgi:hypothetical protein
MTRPADTGLLATVGAGAGLSGRVVAPHLKPAAGAVPVRDTGVHAAGVIRTAMRR